MDAGGIGTEFEQRAKAMGASKKLFFHDILDTEVFKHIADRMVLEAGVVPLLHCAAVSPIMEGNVITGVITESKSGKTGHPGETGHRCQRRAGAGRG